MKNQNMFLGINTLLKPLISPSLAWALGVNVVIAKPVENPPIVQTELGKKTTDFPTPTIGETETAGSISWADSTSQRGLINLISPDFTSKNSPANNISVKFDATKPTKPVIWTGGGLTYFVKATKDLNPKFIFNSNGHGIQLGADGKGDFKLQFKASNNGTPTNTLAELTFTNNTGNTALQGNIIIVGGYSNVETQNPNFAPQNHYRLSFAGDVKGNIDQSVWLSFPKTEGTKGWTPFGEITFTDRDDNSSSINGNLNVTIGGMRLEIGKGRITGDVNASSQNRSLTYLSIYRTKGDEIKIGIDQKNDFIGGKLTLSGNGISRLTLGYKDGVTGNKIISFNPEDASRITLKNGTFIFYNMKQLNFVDKNNTKKTFTLQTGTINSATFSFGREVLSLDSNSTIMEGNLVAKNGKSIRFSFIDDAKSNVIPEKNLRTLVVDGSITVTGGGLSLFYNDRLDCFEAKLTATGKISQTGGYIGRNDAFFEAGTFTADKKNADLITIQGTSGGISHLRFNDNVSVSKGISSTNGNGVDLYFYQGVSVSAPSNGSAVLARGNNTIYLGNTSQFTGKVIADVGKTNIFKLANSSTTTIAGEISTNAGTQTFSQSDGTSATLSLKDSLLKVYGGGTASIAINVDSLTIKGNSSIASEGNIFGTNTILITTKKADITLSSIDSTTNNKKKNTINTESGSFSVTGKISSSGGVNQITSGASTNTIGGVANDGRSDNTISLTNKQATNKITGNISATNDGSNIITSTGNLTLGGISLSTYTAKWGQNNITSQGNITLGDSTNQIVLTTSGEKATHRAGTTIEAKGSMYGYLLSITTSGNNAKNGSHTNILTGGANSNLIIGSMSAITNSKNINTITVGNSSKILVSGNITSKDGGQNIFTFTGGGSTLTLQGQTSQITTLTAVSGNTTSKDTLILDTTNNANATSIDKVVNGANLIVNMGGNATNSATLTLNNTSTNSTIKSLDLTESTSNTDSNILTIGSRTTTILDEVNVASGKGLTINLNGTSTTLELDNGFSNSGNAKISFNGSNGVFDSVIDTNGSGAVTTINITSNKIGAITGDIAQSNGGANDVAFGGGTAKLALQGSSNTLNSVDSTNTGILSLNSSTASTTTIAQLKGGGLTANFGGTDKATKLVLDNSDSSNKTITLAGVTLENSSTNNTLDLTSLTSTTISSAVSVDSGKGLTIALGSTDMTFTNGLSGNSVLSVSGTSSFTTTTGDIGANSLNLVGDGSAKATFKNTTTTLSTLNANARGGNALVLGANGSNTYTLTIGSTNANLTELSLNGSSATVNINGGTQTLHTLSTNATTSNTLNLSNTKTTILSSLNADGSKTLSLTLNNSTLSLGANSSLSSLTANGAVIDLANMKANLSTRAITRHTLTIGKSGGNSGESYKGYAEFIVYVGGGQADNIVFNKVEKTDTNTKSSATITATGGYYNVLNGHHALVATVNDANYNQADGSTENMKKLQGGEVLIGGSLVKTTLIEESDSNGVVKYYLGKGVDEGAPIQYQEVASSALTVNYDLFLANFNSLNKRMGELRDDANSNGVWARVFGGAMSNDFGAGSKTEYITAQAGYDHSLSVGNNARNFMGIAVAYGTSNTQGNTLSMNGLLGSSGSISLNEMDSHMVEVGIYNTFISDSGWYNDTIFKFDYIMSKFSLSNKTDLFTDTNNFAMVLSDEFGYRYKFGENEKGSWYIDPQLELAFGYFNQSDFNRAMYDATGTTLDTIMRATQDTILTLRTRVGASLGKKFNTEKGFASLYVGAFYEYDCINGGNASVEGQIGGTVKSLESIESNGRAMLNVGSNIELTKGARLYIDVEKSFGDRQRTFMQFNLGARYSF